MSDLRQTPLIAEHRALGARLVPFAGWEMPVQYQGISAEHQAVRERAGLFDVSHMGELEVRGTGALEAVNRLITNDLGRIRDGQALYTCACNEAGTILDDLIVYRRAVDDILVVCNASNREKIASHFAARLSGVSYRDASDDFALIALQGPKALVVLADAGSSIDVARDLSSFHFASGHVGGVRATIARTGYTGEDGVELFTAWDDAVQLWRALMAAGSAHGIAPTGLGARDTLRLEARLSLYGNDIDETTNPLEAGLGWVVKLDKPDFLGKSALEAVKARGLTRSLVAFEMAGRGIARHGYPLQSQDGTVVGVCTSGAPSPTLGKNIGLGYLPLGMREVGTRFLVDCRGKAVEAVVVKAPFYKRAK
ncbi:MAG TPA: glycine cleavage system aminomethyltransferase GcvT [Polyangiaceae bacterium]|nr:glycine cleavage system aminomethyltransferase GcvT [Polyangiaceae bacterium]